MQCQSLTIALLITRLLFSILRNLSGFEFFYTQSSNRTLFAFTVLLGVNSIKIKYKKTFANFG